MVGRDTSRVTDYRAARVEPVKEKGNRIRNLI
jgi:hypothetical protein